MMKRASSFFIPTSGKRVDNSHGTRRSTAPHRSLGAGEGSAGSPPRFDVGTKAADLVARLRIRTNETSSNRLRSLSLWLLLFIFTAPVFIAVFFFSFNTANATDSGLVGYWKFDEGSGATSADSSGGNGVTLIGGAAWAAGKFGQGLSLDGVNDYAAAPTSAALVRTNADTSMCFWMNKTGPTTSSGGIVGKAYSTSYAYGVYVDSANGSLRVMLRNTVDDARNYATNITPALNAWTHVCVTIDDDGANTAIKAYENGGLKNTVTGAIRIGDNNEEFRVGRRSSSYTQAILDEVRVYNKALTESEVASIYSGAAPAPAPAPQDTTAPVRSNGAPTGALSAGTTAVTLALTTNESASCKYAASSGVSYADMPSSFTSSGTSHSAAVANLASGSHEYSVRCQDSAGNANSDDYTIAFSITAAASSPSGQPIVSNVAVSNVTANSATITWITNEPADAYVEYGLTTVYGTATIRDTNFLISHTAELTNLSPQSLYHFRARSKDPGGQTGVSPDMTFTTLAAAGVAPAPAPAPTPAPAPVPAPSPAPEPAPPLSTSPVTGKQWYASPAAISGNGSLANPWSLTVAFRASDVKPGDTINLRGGRYLGKYEIALKGAEDLPITIRSYPGEWAVLDSGSNPINRANIIQVRPEAAWLVFRDFEIMSSYPVRTTLIEGSFPNDIKQGEGITVHAPNVKIINTIVHDANLGISAWQDAPNTEIYGNIVFNNGWQGPKEGGSGHGLYIQNMSGFKMLEDNIVWGQFGKGMHPYTSVANNMKNITMEGNIVFQNGIISNSPKTSENIHVGGGGQAENMVIRNNYFYGTPANHGLITLGGQGARNLVFENNVAPNTLFRVWYWAVAKFTNNTLGRPTPFMEFYHTDDPKTLPYVWNNNTYYSLSDAPLAHYKVLPDETTQGRAYSLSGWRSVTNFDLSSTQVKANPIGTQIYIRPNKYEAGRAHIAIYNWDLKPTVAVDISNIGLKVGETYELRNAQDYFGDVRTGTYDGSPITVPMTDHGVAKVLGNYSVVAPSTFPAFGAFVIKKPHGSPIEAPLAGAPSEPSPDPQPSAPADTTAPTVSVSFPAAGATLSGSVNLSASASDVSGISSVKFAVDGILVGEDATAPYTVVFDTTTLLNGSHLIAATARDVAGNEATATVSAVIANVVSVNRAPVAAVTAAPLSGTAPLAVHFSAAGSSDPDGDALTYAWNFGDGTSGTGVSSSHIYTNPGSYAATLTVRDSKGLTTNAVASVSATLLPSRTFALADSVTTTSGLNVRDTAGTGAPLAGSQPAGSRGMITGGPTYLDGFWWWKIDYVTGADGWSVEDYLQKATVPPPDTQGPVVTITAPLPGEVTGMFTIEASVADNVGVTGVEFFVAGQRIGGTVATVPYRISYDAALLSAGSQTITVTARDAAGNTTTGTVVVTKRAVVVSEPSQDVPTPMASTTAGASTTPQASTGSPAGSGATNTAGGTAASGGSTGGSGAGVTSTPSPALVPSSGSAGGSSSGGGGGGGGPISVSPSSGSGDGLSQTRVVPLAPPQPPAAPRSQIAQNISPADVKPLSRSLYRGYSGDDVFRLQKLLIAQGFLEAGNDSGYFGTLTENAVKEFQKRNNLASGGSVDTTGYGAVGPRTRVKINELLSGNVMPVPAVARVSEQPKTPVVGFKTFTRQLTVGARGVDVRELQRFLNANGYIVAESGLGSPGQETDYFGPATKASLVKFQDAYAKDILVPNQLTKGTGFFGTATIKKINELITVFGGSR